MPTTERARRRKTAAIVFAVAVLPGLLMTLHAIDLVPVAHQQTVVRAIQPFEGKAYVATIPDPPFTPFIEPVTVLLDDGRPAKTPMNGAADVVQGGAGRYHVAPGRLYFSAADDSDPARNGRTYTIVQPWPTPRMLIIGLWGVASIGLFWTIVLLRDDVWQLVVAPRFAVLAGALILTVLANRLWLFLDFPLIAIHPDSGSYFMLADALGGAHWPNFGVRPPVYPLFLKAIFSISDRRLAVAVAQTIASTSTALFMIWAAYRWRPVLGLPATIAMGLFLVGFTTIEHDTAMLSESVYASALVLAFSAFLLGLRTHRAGALMLSSTAMGLAILTRPSGLFLMVTLAMAAAWMWRRRLPTRALVAFVVPLPLMMMSISVYNSRVAQVMAPTAWGEANLAVATMFFWEEDPSYPEAINADIRRIREIIRTRAASFGKDLSVIDRTWDREALNRIYLESFNQDALNIASVMGGAYETAGRVWIRRVAFDAIAKHPGIYGKFVVTMLRNYFAPTLDEDFRIYLRYRAIVYYVERRYAPERGYPWMVDLAKEYSTDPPPPTVQITDYDLKNAVDLEDRVLLEPTRLWRIYEFTRLARRLIFFRTFWPAAVFAAFMASSVVLLRHRLMHDGAFAIFIITSAAIGAGLLVSLVEYSQPRYSYPMEWVYGMSVALLPLLWIKGTRPETPT